MEGGIYPWKIQKQDISRGPVADFSEVSRPLPDPPKGMVWQRDKETGDFSLVEENGLRNVTNGDGPSSSNPEDQENTADYFEHLVLPTDTFQGICLKYKISPTKLRQVNRFSGSSLILAPKRLKIPLDHTPVVQDQNSEEYKVRKFLHECPFLGIKEIKA